MKRIYFSLMIVTLFAAACNNPAPAVVETATAPAAMNLDSVKAAIAASNQLYNESFAKGDSAMFIERYTSDAVLMAPNMPAFNGSAAIAGFYKAALTQMGVKGIALTTSDLYAEGDYATEQGTYELMGADNKSIDKGKFLVVWKKTDAGWKMYRDCFNSDNPPPPAAK